MDAASKGHRRAAAPFPDALALNHLAHELNSLLDGSMRCLKLAQQTLHEGAAGSSQAVDSAMTRLQSTHLGLQQMARLLSRALDRAEPDLAMFHDPHPLGGMVKQLSGVLEPVAAQHAVSMATAVTAEAAAIPSASLGWVILNGLRNAIEASAAQPPALRRAVDLKISVNPAQELLILITDTGTGLKPAQVADSAPKSAGHGLGLQLCRSIVAELGGRMSLADSPRGGAIMEVTVPLRRLIEP